MPLGDKLVVALQRVLPKRPLSHVIGALTRFEGGWLTQLAIRGFTRGFGVDLSEAELPRPAQYASFNDFFTRALRPDARPLAGDAMTVVSPADGTLSEIGKIQSDTLIQAKGVSYRVRELFDGDAFLADRFLHGHFATIYLAPHNYHRVHMPTAGRAQLLRYVPGALYSVNAAMTRSLPGLFCSNERIITVCESNGRWLALVMVGAMNVGSIELALSVGGAALSNRPACTLAPHQTVALDVPLLARGAEFGRFNMGSTVIVLASRSLLEWLPQRLPGQALRMGEALGRLLPRPAAAAGAAPSCMA